MNNNIKLKECTKCKVVYEENKENFGWNVSHFRSRCKKCESKSSKKRYEKNSVKISEKNKAKRRKHALVKKEEKQNRINKVMQSGKWVEVKHNRNYLISKNGEVFSKHTEKEISHNLREDGYVTVNLWQNNEGKNHYLHRLLLEHFSSEEPQETVNHKDGNKSNNVLSNLEWMSYSENNAHAIKTGLNTTKHKLNKKGSMAVEQRNLEGELIKVYPSMRQAERETGITATEIGHGIRKGWKYGGFIWELSDNEKSNAAKK